MLKLANMSGLRETCLQSADTEVLYFALIRLTLRSGAPSGYPPVLIDQVHVQVRGSQAGQRLVERRLYILWRMKGVPQLKVTKCSFSVLDNG